MKPKTKARITAIRPADETSQVLEVTGGGAGHRKQPCGGCPWRTDQDGMFPAEAFRISAPTAYDMSDRTFACHESGSKKPATCAGFLLKNADNNMAVRLSMINGEDFRDVHDGGHELHDSYRSMAEANGVGPDDPTLARCRANRK